MQETRGGAARATAQTSEREVVRDAARVNVCAKAAYLSTIGALFSRWGDDYEAAYEAARATAADLAIAPATPVGAVRCRLENEVLTLGAPAAAVPVALGVQLLSALLSALALRLRFAREKA